MPASSATTLTLLYDGDCPLCQNFVRRTRLQSQFGELHLVDARQPSAERDRAEALGLNLNQGFVLFVDREVYFADRAMHALAMMSGRSGLFNWITYQIFRHAGLSRLIYPLLASGRLLILRLLGRGLIK